MGYYTLRDLHRRLSNVSNYCRNGSIQRFNLSVWDYHWSSEQDKGTRFPWWLHHHSLFSAIMFAGVTDGDASPAADCPLFEKPDKAVVFNPTTKGMDPIQIRIPRSSDISLVASRKEKTDVRLWLDKCLNDWLGVSGTSLHDKVDLIRWAVRDPEGPIVDAALLCWPETVFHMLEFLRVDEESPYSFFNEMIPVDRLKEAFELPEDSQWIKPVRKKKRRKRGAYKPETFMSNYFHMLYKDYGDRQGFNRELYEFMYSLAELTVITAELGESEENRLIPYYSTAPSSMPDLPRTFNESRDEQGRPNSSYAALDIIAALYVGAIYGPQKLSELFSRQGEDITQKSDSEDTPLGERIRVRRRPITLEEYNFKQGFRLEDRRPQLHKAGFDYGTLTLWTSPETENGRTWTKKYTVGGINAVHFALPSQTFILSRHDGPSGLEASQTKRDRILVVPVTDATRRVSDLHVEICFVKDEDALEWRLYDRGKTGEGSLNGTLLTCDEDMLLLKREGNTITHGYKTDNTFHDAFFVYPDNNQESLCSVLDGTSLKTGVALFDDMYIFLAPVGTGRFTRPAQSLTFFKVMHPAPPVGNWIN